MVRHQVKDPDHVPEVQAGVTMNLPLAGRSVCVLSSSPPPVSSWTQVSVVWCLWARFAGDEGDCRCVGQLHPGFLCFLTPQPRAPVDSILLTYRFSCPCLCVFVVVFLFCPLLRWSRTAHGRLL